MQPLTETPNFVSQALCNASLPALQKKKGAVRPNAMNEVLKYLIAKCMVKDAKYEATELLERFQLGVGACRGLEAIIHTAKTT